MLNLQIAMFRLILSLLFAGWSVLLQQDAAEPTLDQPQPGQAVQGVVSIAGSTQVEGFSSALIEFRYEDDPRQTWFIIQENIPSIDNDVLASWDTTTITDGIYHLRLMVVKSDGTFITAEVAGVRVRNYSLIETNTPAVVPEETTESSATPVFTPEIAQSTSTAQPPNPVTVSNVDLQTSAAGGLFVALGLFLLFGIYIGLSRLRRR